MRMRVPTSLLLLILAALTLAFGQNLGLKVLGRSRHRQFTQLFSDNFTRANENPLSDGGIWTAFISGDSGTFQIVSDICEGSVTGTNSRLINLPFNANQYVTATFGTAGGTTPGRQLWLRSAASATVNGYELLSTSGQNSAIVVYAYIGGTPTQLASYAVALANGDSFGLAINGYTLYTYHNGILLGSVTDGASSVATGQPGVRINEVGSTTAATFTKVVAGNFSPL